MTIHDYSAGKILMKLVYPSGLSFMIYRSFTDIPSTKTSFSSVDPAARDLQQRNSIKWSYKLVSLLCHASTLLNPFVKLSVLRLEINDAKLQHAGLCKNNVTLVTSRACLIISQVQFTMLS